MMGHTKYTPGPWRVGAWSGICKKPSHRGINHPGPRGDDPCVYTPEFVSGIYGIAADDGKSVVAVSYDELVMTEADAHMLSAAPDLYEALKEIIDTEWIGGKGGFVKARAALAKARGES